MKTMMVEIIGPVLGISLMVYVLTALFILPVQTAWLFWALSLLLCAGTVAATLALARSNATKARPWFDLSALNLFLLAGVTMVAMGCIALSGHFVGNTWPLLVLTALALAAPLGIGAMRLLADPWRGLSRNALVVGYICGLIGFAVMLLVAYLLSWVGIAPLVPLRRIAVVDLFGYELFPSLESDRAIRSALADRSPGISLSRPKLDGILFTVALLYQALQSILAAFWNTLLQALCTFAVAAAAKRVLLPKL